MVIFIVGIDIADLISSLIVNKNAKAADFHCIGHSLGSHICAHAGTYTKTFGFYFDRISGMDPAGTNNKFSRFFINIY